MLEQVIKEIMILRNISLTTDEKRDLKKFWKRPHPERKQLSVVREWATKLDVPVSLLINATKYTNMEEIWKI